MTTVSRTFDVRPDPAVVIDYLKDFSNAEEWDPGTESCTRTDAGPVVVGSTWHNRSKIAGVSTELTYTLEQLSVATFVYAALFAVEGTALWLQKRWGEYLTLVITISFIPLEVYEIVEHTGIGKIITLVLNIAVVVYLVARIVQRRRGGGRSGVRHASPRIVRFASPPEASDARTTTSLADPRRPRRLYVPTWDASSAYRAGVRARDVRARPGLRGTDGRH